MADLEKTIKGLRCHSEPKFGPDEYFCEACPYDEATCGLDVPNDALSLLKAQEPKKVKCVRRLTKVMKGVCPACEMEIESVIHGRLTKFCKFCSQAVKWE